MGKTTSSSLKHILCAKDTLLPMAPQKWNSETLVPTHMERITSKLDALVQDMQMKGLDVKLQKIIDNNIHKHLCTKDQSDIVISSHTINCRHNSESNLSEVESESQRVDPTTDYNNAINEVDKEQNYSQCDKSFNNPNEDVGNFSNINQLIQKDTLDVLISAALILDHSYALSPDHIHPLTFEDDDFDIGSDSSRMSEETDQRSHNLSVDCHYLKFGGINENVSASTLARSFDTKFDSFSKFVSPSSSTYSLTADVASRLSHPSDDNSDVCSQIGSPEPPSCDNFSVIPDKPLQKHGKFRIDSFGSSSSINLELVKFLNKRDHTNAKRGGNEIPSNSSPCSPSVFSNFHSVLQSPTSDWDRSETGSETLEDSLDARTPLRMSPCCTDTAVQWSHPVFHDHDYYAKDTESIPSADDIGKYRRGKWKCTLKNKLDKMNHEKILKAKYLKKELLRKDSLIKSVSEPEPVRANPAGTKTNPVGRPRKKLADKIVEEIDPATGTKLKITGKFQDQYVYYLSKSSRTTARGRHTSATPLKSDKIILPAPNAGDIVIPHLTDADIEALRVKGRCALNLTERPRMMGVSSQAHQSNEFVSDVDSHIVSTILSMESDNIASVVEAETPSIISTADLNPHQPALTESLRLMSGDPSITSEHVLNYLLSMVKDDGLLGSECGFDSSNSVMLPSLPLDSINSSVDHVVGSETAVCDLSSFDTSIGLNLGSGQDLFGITTKSIQTTSSLNNQTLLCAEHSNEADKYHTNKYFVDESLSDDFASFLSDSKETLSLNSEYSHNSMKGTYGSDFSSIGIPQSFSPNHRLASIEKTLDYLGVRDEDIKLDNRVFDTKIDYIDDSIQTQTSDDTPWIVTITLYFNDVPAIVLNNQPFIRLVDIHKQILPAKDTGILKKRCQLLQIPVLCCTEMQRYFLVQYGRAYNSKSTLIVSKDNATDLVTYYATPQPRMARTIEAHQSNSETSSSTHNVLPLAHLPYGINKRHGSKVSRRLSKILRLPESRGFGESPTQKEQLQNGEDLADSHGKRTRHKKINYLDLLKGEETKKQANDPTLKAHESVVKSPIHIHNERSIKTSVKKISKASFPGNSVNNVSVIKLGSILQKRNTEIGPNFIHRVKVKKTKKKNHDKLKFEQEVDVCSEIDSGVSVQLSQSKKCKPLKLKVNSLLYSARKRKGSLFSNHGILPHSSSTVMDRPLRVLSVAHQSALSDSTTESRLPSQAADIHLDLFVKSNSACVCCATCSQFLSVPHFMQHHHVPKDSHWLATEAAQRILVPRNKENISREEQKLWAEFHKLQENIGGFGEADDDTDSSDDDIIQDDYSMDLSGCDDVEKCSMKPPHRSVISLLNVEGTSPCLKDFGLSCSSSCDSAPTIKDDDSRYSFVVNKKSTPISKPSANNPPQLSSEILNKGDFIHQNVDMSSLSEAEVLSEPNTPNTRTSTRKRKSKQLFSIENYYTPKRLAIHGDLNSQKPVLT